ncbi:MAG TPA: hypothetical protein VEI97_13285 [bacterium]|nr:hypothetical protein [bacterium]
MAVAGLWELRIQGGAARLEPVRTGQTLRQQNLFWFDPAYQMHPGDLTLNGIGFSPTGDITVRYTFRHPFAAPDFTLPPSGRNRADLGFGGVLMVLADLKPGQVATHTFFGDVVAHTEAVADPDGFLEPGTLMYRDPSERATAFPYKLIVDEALDNRIGVSNGGNVRGNYNRLAGGWQRFNIMNGTVNNGWTGFDYLHQGQSATNVFTLRRQVLTAPGGFTCKLALVIKYPDPKGMSPAVDPRVRFPEESPANVHRFSYRLPYCAQDVSKLVLTPVAGNLSTAQGSTGSVVVAIRDWDAKSQETTFANIGDDSDIGTVQQGSTGKPAVELHFPALADSFFPGTSLDNEDGTPFRPMRFAIALRNLRGTAPAGPVAGLIRVTDPEANLPNLETYTYGTDAVTLAIDPARYIPPVTYQAVVCDLPEG